MMGPSMEARLGDTTGAFAPGGNGASNGTVVRMRRPGGEKKHAESQEGKSPGPGGRPFFPGGKNAAARS